MLKGLAKSYARIYNYLVHMERRLGSGKKIGVYNRKWRKNTIKKQPSKCKI